MGWNGHGRPGNLGLGTCRTWRKVCGIDRIQQDTQDLGKGLGEREDLPGHTGLGGRFI